MFTLRSLGKILRGKATPLHNLMATMLASSLAFVPGFEQAPGLFLALIFGIIVLNANLGVVLATYVPAKLLSLAMMGTSFRLGTWMLDGPPGGLFESMINAPVLAWFGFDNYATTGGLLPGLALGLLLAFLLNRTLGSFRKKLAGFEQDSERYQRWNSKGYVKLLLWLFFGKGHGKKTYEEMLSKRIGNPIRWAGFVFLAGTLGLVFVLQGLLATSTLTAAARQELELVNGATVDLAAIDLDVLAGTLQLSGLALADSEQLDVDLFRSATLAADLSTSDLLRNRVHIERIVVSGAAQGEKRKEAGKRISPPNAPAPPEEPAEGADGEREKTLEDYLKDAEVWQERLKQVREWLEKLSSGEEQQDGPTGDTEQEREQSLREWLEREVAEKGYTGVYALHLRERAPRVLVSEVIVEDLTSSELEGEQLTLRAWNLSTDPSLVDGVPRLEIATKSGNFQFAANLGSLSGGSSKDDNAMSFSWKGLKVDRLMRSLTSSGSPVLTGGRLSLSMAGSWSAGRVGYLDLPLQIELNNTKMDLGSLGKVNLDSLVLPIGVRGPIDNPRLDVDFAKLAKALRDAGKEQFAKRINAEADRLRQEAENRLAAQREKLVGRIDEKGEELENKAREELSELEQRLEREKKKLGDKAEKELKDSLEGAVGDLLGGKTDELLDDAAGDLKEQAESLLGGLLGGDKDKSKDADPKKPKGAGKKGGKKKAAGKDGSAAKKQVDKLLEDSEDELKDLEKKAKKALGGLLGGKKKDGL